MIDGTQRMERWNSDVYTTQSIYYITTLDDRDRGRKGGHGIDTVTKVERIGEVSMTDRAERSTRQNNKTNRPKTMIVIGLLNK
jgi:phage anti-repressor protein